MRRRVGLLAAAWTLSPSGAGAATLAAERLTRDVLSGLGGLTVEIAQAELDALCFCETTGVSDEGRMLGALEEIELVAPDRRLYAAEAEIDFEGRYWRFAGGHGGPFLRSFKSMRPAADEDETATPAFELAADAAEQIGSGPTVLGAPVNAHDQARFAKPGRTGAKIGAVEASPVPLPPAGFLFAVVLPALLRRLYAKGS
ncbi:hypothetical protein [Parvularcula dongshanensis]|uniref:Uncharacterized protein n=1 Tax=Parvularcula dongshanensis TaxID=1173995 RepID=A0A840I179_9PROT|nr:hypothetical protein [Parvularcula dongshanensis]MBB4658105.1 hypothetical protein [Parvularcula dongshanensis]